MTDNNHTRAPQDKVCGYEYTVKRGDSFYLIAHRLGVPLRDLLEANSEVNPARLMVGDVLCIPMEEDDRVQEPSTAQQPSAPQQSAAPQSTGNTSEPSETVQPSATPAPQQTATAQQPMTTQQPAPTQQPATTQPSTTTQQPATVTQPSTISADDPANDAADSLDQPASPGGETLDSAFSVCPEANRHTIVEGETISDIQLNAGLNLHTLQMANPNTNLDQLTAGQVLCVPDENRPCDTLVTYTLRQEETLESAALRLNVSVGALLRANPCLAPADFSAGMCINVPRGDD